MVTISQEFLRNFRRNSEEFCGEKLRRISRNCDLTKISHLGDQFWEISRISEESVTGNDSREVPRKLFKESDHSWRIWGNFCYLGKS